MDGFTFEKTRTVGACLALALVVSAVVPMSPRANATNFADMWTAACLATSTEQPNILESRPCFDDSNLRTFATKLGPQLNAAVDFTHSFSWDTFVSIVRVNPRHGTTDAFYTTELDEQNAGENAEGVPGNALGLYFCVTDSAGPTGKECDHAHIYLNGPLYESLGYADGSPGDTTLLRSFVCHETGHSFGLWHQEYDIDPNTGAEETGLGESKGCMDTDLQVNPDAAVRTHNTRHMNGHYN